MFQPRHSHTKPMRNLTTPQTIRLFIGLLDIGTSVSVVILCFARKSSISLSSQTPNSYPKPQTTLLKRLPQSSIAFDFKYYTFAFVTSTTYPTRPQLLTPPYACVRYQTGFIRMLNLELVGGIISKKGSHNSIPCI